MTETVIVEVHIVPLGIAKTGLSEYMAAILEPLKQARDLTFELTAMGTIIQGPYERVMAVIRQMHEVPFSMGIKRVYTTINIDDRRDRSASIAAKMESVRSKSPGL